MVHVIIPDLPVRVQYTVGATPITGPFPFQFTFFATGDIDVWIDDALLAEHTHYEVTSNPPYAEKGFQGGQVTLYAPASNCLVTILRALPIERVSDFPDAGSFNRQTLNTTLDKHIAMIQQVDERVDRAFSLPPFAPALSLTPDYFLQVDPTGKGFELISPTQVRAEIQAQKQDATLQGIADMTIGANQIIVATAVDAFAAAPISAYGLSLLDDPDAAALRATLGLGTLSTQNANAVAVTGGTISGAAIAAPTLSSPSVSITGGTITGTTVTGLAVPSLPTDAVNKFYADTLTIGVSKRSTARAGSTVNISIAALVPGNVIDGVTFAVGDRALIKNQTNQAENGVYTIMASGGPVRALDFDTFDENPGSLVTVQEGTVNQDTVWLCITNIGGTLGSSPIVFQKIQVSPSIPVVIAEGGTGQVNALAAFDALKQPATTSYSGVTALATQAEVDAGVDATKHVTPAVLAGRLGDRSFRNLAYRNGGFEVWQRRDGSSGTVAQGFAANASGYVADGWFATSSNAGAFTCGQDAGITPSSRWHMYMLRNPGAPAAGALYLEYPLDADEIAIMRNNPVNLSFSMLGSAGFAATGNGIRSHVVCGTAAPARWITGPGYTNQTVPVDQYAVLTPGGPAVRFSFPGFTVAANVTQATILFSWTPTTVGNGEFIRIDDVQLELGNKATPFERRSFREELWSCQPFFFKTFDYGVIPDYGAPGGGGFLIFTQTVGASASFGSSSFMFPRPMRVAPTITPYNPSGVSTHPYNVNTAQSCSGTTYSTRPNQMFLTTQSSPASIPGHQNVIHATFDASI